MAEATKPKFTKLNNSNYANWKFKMELLLRKQNLWKKVIIGERPSQTINNNIVSNQAEIDIFDTHDDEARGTIGLLVEDDQLAHIRKSATAKAMWNALKEYHEKDSFTSRVTLMRTICCMKLEEGGNAVAHINQMRDLFSRLCDLGEEQLSEQWSSAMLLRSLPGSYDPLVIAIESRREDEITFSFVQQRVIAEYERRPVERVNTSDTVLKVVAKREECFFCKKTGHRKKDCRKHKAWLEKQGDKNKGGGESGTKAPDKVNTVGETNFLFLVGGKSAKGWIIDSGATRHVVHDKEFFTELDETYRSSVELANGQAAGVNGIGKGNLTFMGENGCIYSAVVAEVLYAPKLVGNILSVRRLVKNGFLRPKPALMVNCSATRPGMLRKVFRKSTARTTMRCLHRLCFMQLSEHCCQWRQKEDWGCTIWTRRRRS